MIIKSIKLSKKKILIISIAIILAIFIILSFFVIHKYGFPNLFNNYEKMNYETNSYQNNNYNENNNNFKQNNINSENTTSETKKDTDYIKWFEFNVSYDVLQKTSNLDISSHAKNEKVKYNWIELISYLACKYGNDFSKFKQKDLDAVVSRLKNGEIMESITKNMKNYSYYYEGYEAVLSQFIGEYYSINPNTSATKIISSTNNTVNSTNTDRNNSITESSFLDVYGIKSFHPLAQGYSYSHYDDFGNSRSYGYKRLHFGNDLMGSIGTPVVAVESGYIEAVRLEPIWWLENWH